MASEETRSGAKSFRGASVVMVGVETLEYVIQRIFSAGLRLNALQRGHELASGVEEVTTELDQAVRSIQLMATRSHGGPDLDLLALRLTVAANDIARLASGRHDSVGMWLDEAVRSLHHARLALTEAQSIDSASQGEPANNSWPERPPTD